MNSQLRGFLVVSALVIAGLFWYLRPAPLQEAPILTPDGFAPKKEMPTMAPTNTTLTHGPDGGTPPKSMEVIASGLSVQAKQKVEILRSIFDSKNDNDPRLDSEFKKIDPEVRQALMEMYSAFPMEKRNERGTVLFLLTRDLQSADDLEFLKKAYDESPCTSFQDCREVASQDSHSSGMNEASLNYPQLAGLFQLERTLRARPELLKDPKIRSEASDVLKRAESFPVPLVQNKAASMRKEFGL